MDLIEALSEYNTQAKCIDYLESQRWPEGPVCPYCSSRDSIPKIKELRHKCNKCQRSFSVMVGTIFQSTKLTLPKWFAAIALIKDAKKGISSMQLSRHLKVNKNTAWFLQSRIRRAMKENLSIDGLVEV
ncbi:transposase, partial [Crocinitomix catalasitica]|nr:transposase [Crocinitomix catalasitica]